MFRKEKRVLFLLLALVFLIGLSGCDNTPECAENEVLEEGVCVLVNQNAPQITTNGDATIVVDADFDVLDGVSATDTEDGDLTSSIVVNTDFDNTTVGSYDITYSVEDSGGLTDSVTITIDVINDAPIIEGAVNQEVVIGETFDVLAGVSATDNQDGDLTSSIVVTGSVDVNVLGEYLVTYTVTDSDGGETNATITVSVVPVPDTTAPVIYGIKDVDLIVNNEFDPTWVFATDDRTDSENLVFVFDTDLDNTVYGTYDVTVTVTDEAGNFSTATFTVTVRDYNATELLIIEDLDALVFDVDNLVFPGTGSVNGSVFIWNSSNINVISKSGFVIPPFVGSDPAVVTITVQGFKSGFNVKRTYDLTVEPFPEAVVTSSVTMDFDGTSEEYVVTDKTGLNVYYVNNGNLPYMDIEEFLMMLDGAIDTTLFNFTYQDDILIISYDYEYEDIDGTLVTDTYTATLNFTENTITVNEYGFFESYISETESDYGEGLVYTDVIFNSGGELTIPLGDYNFDIAIYNDGTEDQYIMPIAILNFVFLSNVYYNVYYNGDELYGIDTFGLSGGSAADLFIQDMMRTSSLNDDVIPEDIRWATLNTLVLSMDYFYGLKAEQGVDTFYSKYLINASFFLTADDQDFYRKLYDIAYDLDDMHTWHLFTGFYEDSSLGWGLTLNDLGPDTYAWYDGLWAIQDEIYSKYGSRDYDEELTVVDILDNGKTAVIHITGFTIDTPDEFKAKLDALPGTVENVVIDLAYNTGGNLGAVLRIFGYMTEEPFMYHSQNPVDGSTVTYVMESDYVAYDYNWFIKTSSVTFSAANFMAGMAKEQGIATVIGQASSGGASSISAVILPDGTGLMISSLNVLSTRVGNEVDGYQYLSIEDGIIPDYLMENVYDYDELVALINSIG